MPEIQTDYLESIFDPNAFPQTVERSIKLAHRIMRRHPFDSIAFCGTSGKAMGFILAHQLRLPMVHIRKENENSHYLQWHSLMPNRLFEGNMNVRRYLLVDDFVASGKTVWHVYQTIHAAAPEAECVALLLYGSFVGPGKHRLAPPEIHETWKKTSYPEVPIFNMKEYDSYNQKQLLLFLGDQ